MGGWDIWFWSTESLLLHDRDKGGYLCNSADSTRFILVLSIKWICEAIPAWEGSGHQWFVQASPARRFESYYSISHQGFLRQYGEDEETRMKLQYRGWCFISLTLSSKFSLIKRELTGPWGSCSLNMSGQMYLCCISYGCGGHGKRHSDFLCVSLLQGQTDSL